MRYRPSPRFAEYVRKVMACGHWEDAELVEGNHIAFMQHIDSGARIAYQIHGGNEPNAARNMARDAERICGCRFLEHRGRKKSRKAIDNPLERRRAEGDAQRRINDLITEEREVREAITRARTACLNSRSISANRFLDSLRAERHRIATQLDQLYPEWRQAS